MLDAQGPLGAPGGLPDSARPSREVIRKGTGPIGTPECNELAIRYKLCEKGDEGRVPNLLERHCYLRELVVSRAFRVAEGLKLHGFEILKTVEHLIHVCRQP